jgi:hypothetical protein
MLDKSIAGGILARKNNCPIVFAVPRQFKVSSAAIASSYSYTVIGSNGHSMELDEALEGNGDGAGVNLKNAKYVINRYGNHFERMKPVAAATSQSAGTSAVPPPKLPISTGNQSGVTSESQPLSNQKLPDMNQLKELRESAAQESQRNRLLTGAKQIPPPPPPPVLEADQATQNQDAGGLSPGLPLLSPQAENNVPPPLKYILDPERGNLFPRPKTHFPNVRQLQPHKK